jgi:hypothetical protein
MKYLRKRIGIIILITLVGYVFSAFTLPKEHSSNVVSINIVYDTTAFKNSTDTILFKNNAALTWDDFKDRPKDNESTVANSAIGFKYNANIKTMGKNVIINISTSSFFVRSKSWGKIDHKNAYILKHEQYHFNLARYGAELFKRNLLKEKMTHKNFNTKINKAYYDAWNVYLKLQQQYDKDSNHSINRAQQALWENKIDGLLGGL